MYTVVAQKKYNALATNRDTVYLGRLEHIAKGGIITPTSEQLHELQDTCFIKRIYTQEKADENNPAIGMTGQEIWRYYEPKAQDLFPSV